jgi:UrcA family protein
MMRRFAMIAVVAVALAVSADAAARSVAVRGEAPIENGGFELRQTKVHYGDLDIANRQGARALYARIREAAADSCATPDLLTDRVKQEVRSCRQKAVKQAVAKVHSPQLSKLASAS